MVTADGLLELELLELSEVESPDVLAAEEPESSELESSDELESSELEPSEEVVSSDDEVVSSEDEVVSSDEVVVPELLATDAVACVPLDEVAVPIEPSYAIAPKASAKIASDTATTRLRIREMRAVRARSFSRASSFGEGVCSVMAAKVGGGSESGPGRPRELPGRGPTLDDAPGRSRAAPGCGADHSCR